MPGVIEMATNYVKSGNTMDWNNDTGAAVSSGDVVVAGHVLGVALVDIADGEQGSVNIGEVFRDLPKVSAAVFEQGEKLLWDSSAGKFDDSSATAASGDIMGGAVAWEAGTNGQTTCVVKLTPGNATKT